MSRLLGRALGLLFFVAVAAPAAVAQEAAWAPVGGEAAVSGATDIRETRFETARPPHGPYDRIRLHRYRTMVPTRAVLRYLPGTNMNGQVAVPDEDHNLWTFLARRGVEVFALDYRTTFIPKSGAPDLSSLATWTVDAFAEDVRVAAALVALDGPFKNHAPQGGFDRADALQELKASGRWGNDVAGALGWETRDKLLSSAVADAAGPATDPKFASIGAQVDDLLYGAWGPGGLMNTRAGFAKVGTLSRLLVDYDRYYPAIQDIDGRAIAETADDPSTRIDDGWGKWQVPVIYFGSTGMGADFILNGIYSAGKNGSKDVTLNVLEGFGHLDVVVGEKARAQVFEPALAWILERAR